MIEMRIQNTGPLLSHGNTDGRRAVVEILEAALEAADPYSNTRKLIRIDGERLIVGCKDFQPQGDPKGGDEVFKFSEIGDIYVVGAAKGVQRVAKAIEDVLGDRIRGGHVIAKKGDEKILGRIQVTEGGHPIPDEDCVKGSERILEIAKKARKGDLVFTISGNGGSSLLTLPIPGISLEDIRKVTYLMQIKRGAPTEDLNAVRNHLDVLKVGRLSKLIHPATMIHILIWEPGEAMPKSKSQKTSRYEQLMNENLWLHALPDCTTFADAVRALKKWGLWEEIPTSVRVHLETGDPCYESPKREDFQNMSFRIFGILSRSVFIEAARKKAEMLGLNPIVLVNYLQAEAREAGRVVSQIAKNVENSGQPFKPPCVLITGGELLVTVGSEAGIGGRNQEFVLSAALEIAGSRNIVIGAVDSDGTDGPGCRFKEKYHDLPCFAGGIVDGYSVESAGEAGVDIIQELKKHNSTVALQKLDDGIITSQGVSLNDLGVTLILDRSQ